MKFAFLPNYFKKIGIIGFCASFLVSIVAGTFAVLKALPSIETDAAYHQGSFTSSFEMGQAIGQTFLTGNYWIIQVCSVLLLLSIAFYMLAKEKVDDEYMDVIRWESLRLSLIVSIGIAILAALIHWNITAKNILLLQFIVYLITFKIKKTATQS